LKSEPPFRKFFYVILEKKILTRQPTHLCSRTQEGKGKDVNKSYSVHVVSLAARDWSDRFLTTFELKIQIPKFDE
jgi:hypothetical protein